MRSKDSTIQKSGRDILSSNTNRKHDSNLAANYASPSSRRQASNVASSKLPHEVLTKTLPEVPAPFMTPSKEPAAKQRELAMHEQINVFQTGFDIGRIRNMVEVVKDIDPHEEGKKKAKTMLDDFMIGLAVGEDKVEEVKQKNPKFHLRDYLERIVVDTDGKSRPKFIDPKTGKAFKPKSMSPAPPVYQK
jgi:hypothetical protein